MKAYEYYLEDAIDCPDHLRCEWCFDKARPTKPRAELRVMLREDRYVQLCLPCWFKLAFK